MKINYNDPTAPNSHQRLLELAKENEHGLPKYTYGQLAEMFDCSINTIFVALKRPVGFKKQGRPRLLILTDRGSTLDQYDAAHNKSLSNGTEKNS